MGEKWGEMGANEGIQGIVGNCQRYIMGSVEKMCDIGRKRVKNQRKRDNLGQISHFPHFSTTSPPFPQVPLMNFAGRTSRPENWAFRDWPTFANFSASADDCICKTVLDCCVQWCSSAAPGSAAKTSSWAPEGLPTGTPFTRERGWGGGFWIGASHLGGGGASLGHRRKRLMGRDTDDPRCRSGPGPRTLGP